MGTITHYYKSLPPSSSNKPEDICPYMNDTHQPVGDEGSPASTNLVGFIAIELVVVVLLMLLVAVVMVNIVGQMEELVVVGRKKRDFNLGQLSPVCKPSSWLGQEL